MHSVWKIETPLTFNHVYNFHNVKLIFYRSWPSMNIPSSTPTQKKALSQANFTWKRLTASPFSVNACSLIWPMPLSKALQCIISFTQTLSLWKTEEHGWRYLPQLSGNSGKSSQNSTFYHFLFEQFRDDDRRAGVKTESIFGGDDFSSFLQSVFSSFADYFKCFSGVVGLQFLGICHRVDKT